MRQPGADGGGYHAVEDCGDDRENQQCLARYASFGDQAEWQSDHIFPNSSDRLEYLQIR